MSLAASSTEDAPSGKATKRMRSKTEGVPSGHAYQSLIDAVAQSVKDTAVDGSGPMDTLEKLKEERRVAKKQSMEKTKELKNYAKRVRRLQIRAAKLSDDGLLVEFARRQAAKEKKRQQSGPEQAT